uniref:Uncharacterized protein n=1 Tax=Anguilla anguilla TaxID=7936 RepID=A0A0E9UXS3_ANGAN
MSKNTVFLGFKNFLVEHSMHTYYCICCVPLFVTCARVCVNPTVSSLNCADSPKMNINGEEVKVF